jgi:hypothetical protein
MMTPRHSAFASCVVLCESIRRLPRCVHASFVGLPIGRCISPDSPGASRSAFVAIKAVSAAVTSPASPADQRTSWDSASGFLLEPPADQSQLVPAPSAERSPCRLRVRRTRARPACLSRRGSPPSRRLWPKQRLLPASGAAPEGVNCKVLGKSGNPFARCD